MLAFRIFSNLSLTKTKIWDLEYAKGLQFSRYHSYNCEVAKISMYTVYHADNTYYSIDGCIV